VRGIGDLLLVGALVALIIDGILLIWSSSLELATGVGILCFALAAFAAAWWPGWTR